MSWEGESQSLWGNPSDEGVPPHTISRRKFPRKGIYTSPPWVPERRLDDWQTEQLKQELGWVVRKFQAWKISLA